MNRLMNMVHEYGFRVFPVFAMINGVWSKRPDIVSIRYNGHHIMTAPQKMLREPNERYRTLEGQVQPMFFDIEHKLRNWNLIIKNTPHVENLAQKKMELEILEKNYEKGGKA